MFVRRIVLFFSLAVASVAVLGLVHLSGGRSYVPMNGPVLTTTFARLPARRQTPAVTDSSEWDVSTASLKKSTADVNYTQHSSEVVDVSQRRGDTNQLPSETDVRVRSSSYIVPDATTPSMALPQQSSLDTSPEKAESSAPTFTIKPGFNFPHPQAFLPTWNILGSGWVQDMKAYLLSIHPARSLTITVATSKFIPNLLNWLIAAHLLVDPPLQHILVVAFEENVYTIMKARKFPCIYVPFSSVMKGVRKGVSRVWMTRLAVIRLLNHWGYDVQQFDNDAVLLRHPDPLFEAYSDCDIIGARGILPYELGRGPWGFTLCMGAAKLRATEKMGRNLAHIRNCMTKLSHLLFQRTCGLFCTVARWTGHKMTRRELILQ